MKEKKIKKEESKSRVFERQMYIPKKTLHKKERALLGQSSKKEEEKKEIHSWLRRGFVIFLWIIFVGEVVYIVLFAHFFVPHTIRVDNMPAELRVESFIRQQFEGKYLSVIPKNNLLLVTPQNLERQLKERYPRFKNVFVQKNLPEALVVGVELLPYQLLWCKGEQCLLVTEEGVLKDASIFFQYPEEQGLAYTIRDESQRELLKDSKVLTKEEVLFLATLIRDFNSRTGLEREGDFVRPSIYTEEIRLYTKKGFWVYLSTKQDLGQTLDNLVLFLNKEIPQEEWGQLDYVDLRTENRVYYTRKDRQPENKVENKEEEEQESSNTPPASGT